MRGVPHVLHDVNHDSGGAIAGAFANRVYPALVTIDAFAFSYGEPGDASLRLHPSEKLARPGPPGSRGCGLRPLARGGLRVLQSPTC